MAASEWKLATVLGAPIAEALLLWALQARPKEATVSRVCHQRKPEALRVLRTEGEAANQDEIIHFPAVRCDPKPVQKPCPPILLGAHGPKALERVARTYDGWMPLAASPEQMKRDVATIPRLAADHGRKPDSIQITVLVDSDKGEPSEDDLKRYP